MATIAECAEHLFIDERTFKRHLDEGNITRKARAGYEIDEVRREYLDHMKKVASGRANETSAERVAAGTRKDDAIAERYELEVAQKKGELLPRDEVIAGLSSVFGRVRARLLAIPTKLAPAVHGMGAIHEIQEKLSDAVNEALEELAGTIIVGVSEDPAEPKGR
ncbi:MAG: hypothetical protein CMP81_05990 [Fulvimarina sp.]|nr:hypothetical protein [Fulvimarina sp.]